MTIYFFVGSEFSSNTDFSALNKGSELIKDRKHKIVFLSAWEKNIDALAKNFQEGDVIIGASAGGSAAAALDEKVKNAGILPFTIGFEALGDIAQIESVLSIVQADNPKAIDHQKHCTYQLQDDTYEMINGKKRYVYGHAFYAVHPDFVNQLSFDNNTVMRIEESEYVIIPAALLKVGEKTYHYTNLMAKTISNQSLDLDIVNCRIFQMDLIHNVASADKNELLPGLNMAPIIKLDKYRPLGIAKNTLEKFIDTICTKAIINFNIQELKDAKKYIEGIYTISSDNNREVKKACLREIEAYLAATDVANQVEIEYKKLEYYQKHVDREVTHLISVESYILTPLIRLLNIRHLLIMSLQFNIPSISNDPRTGSWCGLNVNSDYCCSLNFFAPHNNDPMTLVRLENRLDSEIKQQLMLSKNSAGNANYFAFRLSNGTYSEPYILKIVDGSIEALICSTSGHKSSALHSYLATFVKQNYPNCKVHATLPLQHDGDCTRYSDYALIQFKHLSELYGADEAYELLSKKTPYQANAGIFRDFELLSSSCAYDLLKQRVYPLPKRLAEECQLESLEYEPVKQTKQGTRDFKLWFNKLREKCEELHQRYPQDDATDLTTAFGTATRLITTLNSYLDQYHRQEIELAEFNQLASAEIRNNVNGVLGQHRGIKEILINLLFAIGTLGIGYALAALFTQRFNPIRCQTDSVTILGESEELFTQAAPAA